MVPYIAGTLFASTIDDIELRVEDRNGYVGNCTYVITQGDKVVSSGETSYYESAGTLSPGLYHIKFYYTLTIGTISENHSIETDFKIINVSETQNKIFGPSISEPFKGPGLCTFIIDLPYEAYNIDWFVRVKNSEPDYIFKGSGKVVQIEGLYKGDFDISYGTSKESFTHSFKVVQDLNQFGYVVGKHTSMSTYPVYFKLSGLAVNPEHIRGMIVQYNDDGSYTVFEEQQGDTLVKHGGQGRFAAKFYQGPEFLAQKDFVLVEYLQNGTAYVDAPDYVDKNEEIAVYARPNSPFNIKNVQWYVDNEPKESSEDPYMLYIQIKEDTAVWFTYELDQGKEEFGLSGSVPVQDTAQKTIQVKDKTGTKESYNVLGWRDNYLLVGHWVIEDIQKCIRLGIKYKDILEGLLPNNMPGLVKPELYLRDTAGTKAAVTAWAIGLKVQDSMNGNVYSNDRFDS